MNYKTSNSTKMLGLLLFSIIVTFINDEFVRVAYWEYNNELRLIDHLIAGTTIPIMLYLLLGGFYEISLFYFIWSSYWEISQYINRGYLQLDQYLFDILGIGLAIYLYHKNYVVRKTPNNDKLIDILIKKLT